MGFFDFLKNKKQVKEVVETKKELSIQEIEEESKSKIKDIDKEIYNSGALIVPIVKESIPLLKEGVERLKKVNLDKRREDQKLKIIINENLAFYISHLESLIDSLNKIDEKEELKDYTSKINLIFESFFKNSAKNYEKATILVGKEFESVNLVFKNISQTLNPLLTENLEKTTKKQKLSDILDKIESLKKLDETENKINEDILSLNQKNKKEQEGIREKEQDINNLIKSKEYRKHKEERDKVERAKLKIKEEIHEIREKINLKELAKIYHSVEKKHKVIQRYMENFDQAISEDNLEFDNILKERVLNLSLSEVAERKKKLDEYINSSEVDVKKISKDIESRKNKINEINRRIEEEKVKLIKFNERKEALVSEVKKEANEMLS
jgi:hypothetical protein